MVNGMKLLRDLKETTKLLILLEIVNARPRALQSISSKLGITVQGISDYVRGMSEEGLVKKIGGEYRATKKGVDLLESRMFELKDFVDTSIRQLEIIETCDAIAGNDIKRDEQVGLFMEDGILVAYKGKESPSKGFAMIDAVTGEDVSVREPSGLVTLKPGRITVLQLPSLKEGGTHSLSIQDARKALKGIRFSKMAIMDVVSRAFLNTLGIKPDFDFAPLPSSFEAAVKGMDVLIVASREMVPLVVSDLEAENSGLEDPIPYEVRTLA
jgi:putative transcriptional regulator